ncbi:MAG: hypothetical protein SPJ62_08200, partial [Inconstantimicrobium porci]|nr:hypothetical protein [Inconstantimicrobium porci]
KSISERPTHINNRQEFGHWEVDTVVGEKTNSDSVLLTISVDNIGFIEEWMNTLPRKILDYRTPEELFEKYLDEIYAA